jgi:hypothetical protein
LREQLSKKGEEMNEFAIKYKIQVKGEDERKEGNAKNSAGVLV